MSAYMFYLYLRFLSDPSTLAASFARNAWIRLTTMLFSHHPVPVDTTTIRCLYVFVEIGVDTSHLLDTVKLNFPGCLRTHVSSEAAHLINNARPAVSIESDSASPQTLDVVEEQSSETCHIAVVGTVQFLAAVHGLKESLEDSSASSSLQPSKLAITAAGDESSVAPSPQKSVKWQVTIPQVKPLSPGEILGCTAPKLPADVDALLYVGDGRFHLESIMIANPSVPAYRYDPYSKKFTLEEYDHTAMLKIRGDSISEAKRSLPSAAQTTPPNWAVILGTLGRQGSLSVLKTITSSLPLSSTVPILLSELSPAKLSILSPHINTFVQTSCPRLSIDWGYAFPRPLLSTYEASVALGKVQSRWLPDATAKSGKEKVERENRDYPMDFYADESLGAWTPRWQVGQRDKERREKRLARERERAAAAAAALPTMVSASA